MYSYEDKLRTVELFVHLGMRVWPPSGGGVLRKADHDLPRLSHPTEDRVSLAVAT